MDKWFWLAVFVVSAAILYLAFRKPPVPVATKSSAVDLSALVGVVASVIELI
jgi:hypothetical protein